ncbi:Protein OOC-3 a [Aphelenchoides avenae]|nr:Protein OOC-3 a [Aphelenchus avenae]
MRTPLNVLCFVVLLGIPWAVNGGAVDIDLHVDKTNWIDPTDPLPVKKPTILVARHAESSCPLDCSEENEQLRNAYAELQQSKASSVDVLLKHILRQFFRKLNVDVTTSVSVFKTAEVLLSANELDVVRRYLGSNKSADEFGLREDVRFALENFVVESDVRSEGSMFSLLHRAVPYIMFLNVLILPLAAFGVARSIFSLRQLILIMLIGAFFVSCYFTYARKYQEVLAHRFTRLEQRQDAACSPNGLMAEAYNVILSYVRIKGKSECLQKYEDLLIEPILQVDVLQVVAEVLTNFFLSPLSVVGGHLNKFFNDFFVDTPIHLALVKTLFLLFVLFFMSGYRIRTLLATLEPAESIARRFLPPPTSSDSQGLLEPRPQRRELQLQNNHRPHQHAVEHRPPPVHVSESSPDALVVLPSSSNEKDSDPDVSWAMQNDQHVTKDRPRTPQKRSRSLGRTMLFY